MSATDVRPASTEPAGRDQRRTAVIASLLELAVLLEQNPDLPLPWQLDSGTLDIHLMRSDDPRGELARIVRMLPGEVRKEVWGDKTPYFTAHAKVGSIRLDVTTYRDQVCERVVTGTREVTETVPDPHVVVPLVEVTKTVEDVEWVCGPLMAPAVER